MTRVRSRDELEELRQRVLSERDEDAPCITVCAGTGCLASGAREVVEALENEINEQGLSAEVGFRTTGCHGFCEKGPIVVIDPEEICCLQVTPEDVPEIISETVEKKKVIERLLYVDPNTGEGAVRE
jgi:NADH:ubiquinone oxidoreductase subunit E